MKVYTRTGDDGLTGIIGASREAKVALRFEAIGALDELNSHLGLCLVGAQDERMRHVVSVAQNLLFDIGAELARDSAVDSSVSDSHIVDLEVSMDVMTSELAPLRNFILPGGTELAARLHLARTVCRRAEREALRWHEHQELASNTRVYLNRLSDWLFVAARYANHIAAHSDVLWTQQEGTTRS